MLRHRLVVNFAAESDGVTRRQDHRPPDRQHPHQGRRAHQRCPVQKDFCILRRSSGSRGWNCGPGTSSKGFCRGCTAARTSASRSSSCSIANTSPATTCGTSTGKSGPGRTGCYVKQFEEETNLRCTLLVDVSQQHGVWQRAAEQIRIRLHAGLLAGLPGAAAARRRRLRGVRRAGARDACRSARKHNHIFSIVDSLAVQEPRDKTDMYAHPARGGRNATRGAA